MKICVLTHTFPRDDQDSTAAFMKEFCDGLVENGHSVFVVTPFDEKFKRKGDRFKVFTYKYIWPERLHLLGYSRTMEADQVLRARAFILIPFMLLFGTIKLLGVVRKNKIDIINAHWIVPNGLMALIVSKLTKVPYVITLPGTDAYLAYRYKIIRIVAKVIAKGASGIFSNSSFHLNRILNLGISPKFKDIISYPTDIKKFKPKKTGLEMIRKRHNIHRDAIVLLAVGRMVYKKGFDLLIKALKPLKDYQLSTILAGEGDLKANWMQLSTSLGLESKVLFIGNIKRDEIVKYYNLADIMVAPSIVDEVGNVDGGPVSSFESMACGKPQIVTNVLGVADVIKDGVHGLIISQKNVKSLTEALKRLIRSKTLRQKMGKASRELIKSRLSTESIGRIYSQYFLRILS